MNPLLVFVGGGLGALLRYGVGRAVLLGGGAAPLATLGINIVGCFAMGLASGWFMGKGLSQTMWLFLATGLLGGFTTFSAFSLDALTLYRSGAPGQALTYIAASLIVSLTAVASGAALVR